jgi:hypothetical protein
LGGGKETPDEASGYDRATVLVESGNGSGANEATGDRGELTKIMEKRKSKNQDDKKIVIDDEAMANLVGLFSLLLKIDRRLKRAKKKQ